jgi:uncharacterized protein (TIGR03085 family)
VAGTGTNYARTERAALCDLFIKLGPDVPTLCAGWAARDLAAHLVLRERRPDAALGIMLKPFAGHTGKVQSALALLPFDELVARVRHPPAWSPLASIGPIDRAANTMEFFIHHEDLRRAQPVWSPRELPRDLGSALWARARGTARLALRRFASPVAVAAPGYGEAVIGTGEPPVRLIGDPGELVLFLTGRQSAARVEVTGPQELTDRLRTARLGL